MARKTTGCGDREVAQIAERLQSLGKQAVDIYGREVDRILGSTCREKDRIEHTLDGMLGFCYDKNMLMLYKKLCRHYYDIDRNATIGYVYAYRGMWDSEDCGNKKRKQR